MLKKLALLFAFGAALALASTRAAADNYCGPWCANATCDETCTNPDTYDTITCGQGGYGCNDCQWHQVSHVQIGANGGGISGLYCTWWVTFLNTDQNTCTNEQRVSCDHYMDGWGTGNGCCEEWGCWGASSC